jgi:hypothetical protein
MHYDGNLDDGKRVSDDIRALSQEMRNFRWRNDLLFFMCTQILNKKYFHVTKYWYWRNWIQKESCIYLKAAFGKTIVYFKVYRRHIFNFRFLHLFWFSYILAANENKRGCVSRVHFYPGIDRYACRDTPLSCISCRTLQDWERCST